MISKNAMQLKAFIKKIAAEKKLSSQQTMQSYMMERLLERIALSDYRDNFILKGGFLIMGIVGLDIRTTMDMDATIKGIALNEDKIREIFSEICAVPVADNIRFEMLKSGPIRKDAEYPGIRVFLEAHYPPMKVSLTVDITTGDAITPGEVEFAFPLIFDDRQINILAYNLETVLAEKLEAVLSRNIASTRPRDYYDIHILNLLRRADINDATLKCAFQRTVQKRGRQTVADNYEKTLEQIQNSDQLRDLWEKYRKDFAYAREFSFDDVCTSLKDLMHRIMS